MHNTLTPQYGTAAFLLALLAAGASCTPPPPRDTHDADVRSITEGEMLWARHWSTRDAESIVAHYSEGATVMVPHMPPFVGREAIREMVKAAVRDGSFDFSFEARRVEVARSGGYGYAQGSYTLTTTDVTTRKAATDHGAFLRVYRKQLDGAWKVLQDIRASSVPARPVGP